MFKQPYDPILPLVAECEAVSRRAGDLREAADIEFFKLPKEDRAGDERPRSLYAPVLEIEAIESRLDRQLLDATAVTPEGLAAQLKYLYLLDDEMVALLERYAARQQLAA